MPMIPAVHLCALIDLLGPANVCAVELGPIFVMIW
jgi:hypothetical protein